MKKRGLPQTGLKPALVARLTAADNDDGSDSEATVQGDPTKLDTGSVESPDTVSPILPSPEFTAETIPDTSLPVESEGQQSTPPEPSISERRDVPLQSTTTEEIPDQVKLKDDHQSALPSVEPQEANEDRQKRKRRSQTPPISASDAARKRVRTNEDRDDDKENNTSMTTQENADWVEKDNAVDSGAINAAAKEVDPSDVIASGPTIFDTSMEDVKAEPAVENTEQMEGLESEKLGEEEEGASFDDSQSKIRGDSRFKQLFSGDANQEVEMGDAFPDTENDRIISPAIHPATSALYISDIMRPLNPAQLKQHIALLAAPPGQEPDPEVIVSFYIDSIRTHAFVSFTSISAASRVRSALHDRIWPDEKTRKPLWIDFVPVEMIEKWVEQEQVAHPSARTLGKKWEVSYNMEEGRHVTTILQEVSNVPRKHSLQRQGFQTASPLKPPTQPRNMDVQAPHPQLQIRNSATVSAAGGQLRLNELFKSTSTKPVLYYQPVSKEIAEKRLDNIDTAMSKDAKDGIILDGPINRYTFEDTDVLVDRGPEIFPGIRPPPGHRGPVRGGGSSRREPSRGAERDGYSDRATYGGGRGGYGGGERSNWRGGREDRGDRGGYSQGRDSYRGGGVPERRYDSYRGDRRDSREYGRR